MAKVINTVLSLKDDFSNSLQKAAKNAQTSVGHIKKAFADGDTGSQRLSNGLKQTGKEATKVGKAFMPISGAVGGALGLAAKTAGDFESQMLRVNAISGATGSQFDDLRKAAIDLGAKSVFSASETAEAMENLASAGFTTNEIIGATPGLLDLAASSGSDLATASDIAASALRAFGLSAEEDTGHVADVLAENAGRTNAAVEDTGEALKYIGPVAYSAGLSLEEVTAAIGIMSNAGIKGSQAGTTLRGALTRIMKPTKQVQTAMDQLGISMYDQSGKMKPLSTIIGDLKTSMKGLTDEEKQQRLAAIFGTESLSGMMALVNAGPEELSRLTRAYEDCNGSAAKMAKTMNGGVNGAIEQMKGAIESMAINLGSALAPAITTAANVIGSMAQKFAGLSPGAQKVIGTIGLIIAAIGPLLIIIGSLISAIGTIAGAIGAVGIATLGPIAMLAVVIAAIVAFAVIVTKHSDQIMAVVNRAVSAVKGWLSSFTGFLSGIGSSISGIISSVQGIVTSKINGIKQTVSELKHAAEVLRSAWSNAMSDLGNKIKSAYDKVKKWAGKIKDTIKGIPSRIGGAIGGALGIGGHATGTPYFAGGLTRINEHGGEIVSLPNGTKIIPHDIAKQSVSGASVTVNVNVGGNIIGNEQYADYLGRAISRKIMKAMANS